jgi:hypothetical protein
VIGGLLLAVIGCGGPPAGIPDSPGTITEAELPNLLTIGSPDLPWVVWQAVAGLETQDYRACPRVYAKTDGFTAQADDCVDSSGVSWSGGVTTIRNGRSTVVTLRDFGPDDGVGGWQMDGQIRIEQTESGSGYLIDARGSVVSLAGEQSFLLWLDTSAAYAAYDGTWFADEVSGTVGLQDWGTASLAASRVPLALPRDCDYAAHFAGSLRFDGTNTATIGFSRDAEEETSGADDTGGGDTDPGRAKARGDTGDTGGDTGGDTAGDTAETGDTDDTADTSDTIPDADDEPDGECGVCATGTVNENVLEGCISPERALSWPFPPPF